VINPIDTQDQAVPPLEPDAPAFCLDDFLAPLGARAFVEQHWDQRYLHLDRGGRGGHEGLFAIADVDRWLAMVRNGPRDSILLTPGDGTGGGGPRQRPEDVSPATLYDTFAKGGSVVLNHLEASWPALAPLVAGLGRDFCAKVNVNAYLTAQGTQTFPLHLDDQDNLILQVEGEKSWRLYERAHRPVHRGRLGYDADLVYPPFWGPQAPETPQTAELRLRPGDLLYVPRGLPHCAVAERATSLHLTVSITPLYWLDVLKAAVEQAHLHAPELCRALPPDFVTGAAQREGLRQGFAEALQAFLDHLSFDDTLDVLLRNRVRTQGLPPGGHLAHLAHLADLRLDTPLCHRPGILCMVEGDDRFATIRYGTQHLQAPARIRPALELIRDHPRLTAADIPGLDDDSKLVLARRLIRGGLLQLAPA